MLIRGLIRWLEKLLDRYYEGPEPPRRLAEEWRVWLALQQQPDIQMVNGYVGCLLEAAYRDGFVRGYDWQERGWKGPSMDPEVLAEMQSHDWSLAESNPRVRRILEDGSDPSDPLANVAAPDKRAFIEFLAAGQGIRVLPGPQSFEED
jgi:hypothetical protein